MSELSVNHKAGRNRSAFLITLQDGEGGENESFSELHSEGTIIAAEKYLVPDIKMEDMYIENIFGNAKMSGNEKFISEIIRVKTENSGIIKYNLAGESYVLAFEKMN